jgi:hypothetical protein
MDTGGGFRPKFRPQAPNKDPKEPNGSESNSRGDEHGWNNCTLSSGGMAHAWHRQSSSDRPWGGDLRHKQGDLDGGTDLNDLKQAWANWDSAELKIWSGQGWSKVEEAYTDYRAIVAQGTGNTPGSGTYTGAHAIVILPERHSSGEWLIGDPLCTDYQRVPKSKIKEWMQRFSSGYAFAVSAKHPPSQPIPPTPTPTPEPKPPPPYVPPPQRLPPALSVWTPTPMLWGALRWSDALWGDLWPVSWETGWNIEYWGSGRWRG